MDETYYGGCGRGGTVSIEERLEKYANCKERLERHEIMWHAWKHNKRWLVQLQEWIMPSFPTYSRHDETHAISVLHNIEMLLGKEQIENLSASDCFLILHVVYIHDIGMCITHEAREKLVQNKRFINFLEELKQNGNDIMQKYAECLLDYPKDKKSMDKRGVLQDRLEVYYAILYLVSEYRRIEHPLYSRKMLDEWIDAPDKLGSGFSTSGIPSRFFNTIGACASVHASNDFEDVMNLHKEDTGYAHDYMHPRFAAVLLQLGDSLDLDNDRFHPLVQEFMGELSPDSKMHFGKHKAIRRLRISPDKITIEADCETPEVLRLVNMECENIKNILRDATFHWSVICPEELNACLPAFEPVRLLLKGQEIQSELVNVKFEIQQKKAFNLLQGSNIYKDDSFVFLREILQNAIDASKMQYWLDWQGSRWYREGESLDIADMAKKLSPISYPIEIEIHLAKKEKYGTKRFLLDRILEGEEYSVSGYVYGVLIRVIDHGIGMTASDIGAIADVGTSFERRKDMVEEMPKWLQPTAEFGIGLQSAFLVANSIVAYTHPHTDENYKIEFQATGSKGRGFINVTPLEKKEQMKCYGTIFEIFVPNNRRKKQKLEGESWCGRDPFSEGYDQQKEYRHTRELAMQLVFYLNELICERLFPINVRIYDFKKDREYEQLEKHFLPKGESFDCEIFIDGERVWDKSHDKKGGDGEKEILLREEKERVTWAYKLLDQEDIVMGEIDNGFQYAFDIQKVKLYIWNNRINVYARFGADRLKALRMKMKKAEVDERWLKTKIFYKGIFIKEFNWKEDADLLEYIDIKGKMEREYLAINRGGFTERGYNYIYQKIYPSILEAAHEVMRRCGEQKENGSKDICGILKKNLKDMVDNNQKSDAETKDTMLSVIALAMYAVIRSASSYPAPADEERCEEWQKLLGDISNIIEESKKKYTKGWVDSTFFKLRVFEMKDNGKVVGRVSKNYEENVAAVLQGKEKYAIVSRRGNRNGSWEEYLVKLVAEYDEEDKCGPHGIKERIMALKMQWDIKARKKNIDIIEAWGETFIESAEDMMKKSLDYEKQTKVLNQNRILNWMLENLPSIAMFFSADSNVRINILDLEHTDSMYFNMYAKWSVYERMYENYQEKGVERFSMIATTGFCQLAHKKEKPSVYFVKRGKLSGLGLRRIIFPLDGEVLGELLEMKRKSDINKGKGKYYKLFCFFLKCEEYIMELIKDCEKSEENDQREEGAICDYIENVKRTGIVDGSIILQEIEHKLAERLEEEFREVEKSEGTEKIKGLENIEGPENTRGLENTGEPKKSEKKENSEKAGEIDRTRKSKEITEEERIREEVKTLNEKICKEIQEEITDEKLQKVLEWGLGISEDDEIKAWLIQYIEPAYRIICDEKKRKIFYENKEWQTELLEKSGLSIEETGKNRSVREVRQRLTKFIKKENWVGLSEEQIIRLYQFLVRDIAEELSRINAQQCQKKIKNSVLLSEIVNKPSGCKQQD